MEYKRCFKCLQSLPIDEFYKHKSSKDGRIGKCKGCTKMDVREHRLKNLERVRQYDRMRASQPHRMRLRKEVIQEWTRQHPDRKAAQTKVSNAIRDGRLIPMPCWVCGAKAEAHHPDYASPLDVVWLCRPHHMQTHALVKQGMNLDVSVSTL